MISGKKRCRLLAQGRTLLISDLLRGLGSLLVAAQSADALYHQVDGQDHQQDADDAADVAPHHTLAVSHDAGDLCALMVKTREVRVTISMKNMGK